MVSHEFSIYDPSQVGRLAGVKAGHYYDLTLPKKKGHLSDKNFIVRLLYNETYNTRNIIKAVARLPLC